MIVYISRLPADFPAKYWRGERIGLFASGESSDTGAGVYFYSISPSDPRQALCKILRTVGNRHVVDISAVMNLNPSL